MKIINEMDLSVKSLSINEGFVRGVVAGFCVECNPSLDEITDIKTAVSEAITNCVVHAYPDSVGKIDINVKLYENMVKISITDYGIGIDNIEQAIEPFFTTKPDEERSGMGFTVMESFMDEFKVTKNKSKGITVQMTKIFGRENVACAGV